MCGCRCSILCMCKLSFLVSGDWPLCTALALLFFSVLFQIAQLNICLIDLCRVKKSLSETKPDDVDLFTKNVQTFIKDVLANYKEYQLFCGIYILSILANIIIIIATTMFIVLSCSRW